MAIDWNEVDELRSEDMARYDYQRELAAEHHDPYADDDYPDEDWTPEDQARFEREEAERKAKEAAEAAAYERKAKLFWAKVHAGEPVTGPEWDDFCPF